MDLKELCRTCLRAGKTMVSIFSLMQVPALEHTELQILEIVKIFTDISLSPDNNLPNHICCDCVYKILQSYTFKLKLNKSEAIIQQLYGEESKVNQSIESSNENHSVTCLELIKIENIKDHEKTINTQLEESGLPESFAMKQETFFVQEIKQEPEIEINSTEDCEIFPNKIPFTNLMEPKRTTHVNDKKFKCTMCSKKYSRMPALNEHILKKHPEKNHFLCDVCPNKFGLKCYLVKHMETAHEYIRKHKCVGCSMFFETERVLNDHNLAIHTGDKLFQCKFCLYKYGLETDLTEHMRTVHIPNIVKFKCMICSKLFRNDYKLKIHMITHSRQRFKCKVCSQKCKSEVGFKVHLKKAHNVKHSEAILKV